MKPKLLIILGVLVLVIGGLAGIAISADSAIHGDLLFPIDKAMESVGRLFTSGSWYRGSFEYEKSILAEREQELQQVQNPGNEELIKAAEEEVKLQNENTYVVTTENDQTQDQNTDTDNEADLSNRGETGGEYDDEEEEDD